MQLVLWIPAFLWLIFFFLAGAAVGSFLNVCIYRLPHEKSLLWPHSRCGHCLQVIRWYDNIPLISYWLLRGRCRTCGHWFSMRYFGIELLTSLSFAGLFYLEVIANVHNVDPLVLGPWQDDLAKLTIFLYHAILVSFLLVATFCDIDSRSIPLSLTLTGTAVGLIGSVIWPWPWPYSPAVAAMTDGPWWAAQVMPREGLYAWPLWGPPPSWLPQGSIWLGLATGLAGLLVGTLILRLVRISFGVGMGAEYMDDPSPEESPGWFGARWLSWLQRVGGKTMGLGDADLMMMAGAFLGWQPVLLAFFVAVVPGLFFGLAQLLGKGENELPFGPSLAIGVILTFLFWHWIGRPFQVLFFNDVLLFGLAGACFAFMLVSGYVIRLLRLSRQE